MSDELRAEIESYVTQVLKPEGLSIWWLTPLPRLHNASPSQMLAAGDGDRLLAYVKTYTDASFT